MVSHFQISTDFKLGTGHLCLGSACLSKHIADDSYKDTACTQIGLWDLFEPWTSMVG